MQKVRPLYWCLFTANQVYLWWYVQMLGIETIWELHIPTVVHLQQPKNVKKTKQNSCRSRGVSWLSWKPPLPAPMQYFTHCWQLVTCWDSPESKIHWQHLARALLRVSYADEIFILCEEKHITDNSDNTTADCSETRIFVEQKWWSQSFSCSHLSCHPIWNSVLQLLDPSLLKDHLQRCSMM